MSRTLCRLCMSTDTEVVLDLGHHPLADRFLTPAMLAKPEITYPLRVFLCLSCGYTGLTHVVHETVRYQADDYSYTAGNSPVSVRHFDELADEIVAACGSGLAGATRLAVDIGGNDGTLLAAIAKRTQCRVLNVEASRNIAQLSQANGVPTARYGMFGEDSVDDIRDRGGADLIVMTNVFNHASEPVRFLEWVDLALNAQGTLVIEVPSASELLRRGAFDTVYLEHVSYWSLGTLRYALAEVGLVVVRAETIPYMGGSLRVWARKERPLRIVDSVDGFVMAELAIGLGKPMPWRRLAHLAAEARNELMRRLAHLDAMTNRIVAIGAAAKGNTLLNYCKLDTRLITHVVDTSPHKIGKFTPGSHIPIVGDDGVPPDTTAALILPWNLADHLRDRYAAKGWQFVVPQSEAP